MDAEKEKKEIEKRESAFENEREKILEEARRQAQKILSDAKDASDAAFDELAELKRQAAAEQFAIDVVGARAKHARRLNEAAARANPDLPRRSDGPKTRGARR